MENISLVNEFMEAAFLEACKAQVEGEVPVGAVIVKDKKIIARGYNQMITASDPTAHAEIIALRNAANVLGNYRLIDCSLYVTLEPCMMCVGAMVHARIKYVYFGAYENKAGAIETKAKLAELPFLNHRLISKGGILEEKNRALLTKFFATRRSQKQKDI